MIKYTYTYVTIFRRSISLDNRTAAFERKMQAEEERSATADSSMPRSRRYIPPASAKGVRCLFRNRLTRKENELTEKKLLHGRRRCAFFEWFLNRLATGWAGFDLFIVEGEAGSSIKENKRYSHSSIYPERLFFFQDTIRDYCNFW